MHIRIGIPNSKSISMELENKYFIQFSIFNQQPKNDHCCQCWLTCRSIFPPLFSVCPPITIARGVLWLPSLAVSSNLCWLHHPMTTVDSGVLKWLSMWEPFSHCCRRHPQTTDSIHRLRSPIAMSITCSTLQPPWLAASTDYHNQWHLPTTITGSVTNCCHRQCPLIQLQFYTLILYSLQT